MLELGQSVAAIPGSVPLVLAEKGEARALGAKGEIPYRLTPGETYYYADLSGPGGIFATLDYSETPPMVFVGREVTLARSQPCRDRTGPEREVATGVGASTLCPQCGGALDLRAPDQTERVTCPNCGSLLDVSQGQARIPEGAWTAQDRADHSNWLGWEVRRRSVDRHRVHAAQRRVRRRPLLLGRVSAVRAADRISLAGAKRRPLELRAVGTSRRGHHQRPAMSASAARNSSCIRTRWLGLST